MTLNTRKPTGRAGWPKILVEGGDKAGKSWCLAQLSASPKVGRTVVLALGEDETRWDEYGLIPGARFEIALHDGTWSSIMAAVEGAKEEAAKARDAGGKPFVFGFDTVTAEWEGLKDWASLRARSSKKNKAILAQDPDAEIDVTSNYWNDARARHRVLMRHLLTFPGIVVLIARGSEVTAFHNGQPVAGRKTWSVEGERNLPYDVSTHIRLSRDSRPLLVSASGVHCQIRPGIDPPRRLPDDWSLESVIFDTLKLDVASAAVGEFVEMQVGDLTPERIRDEAASPQTTFKRLRELWAEAKRLRYEDVALMNETGDDEGLLDMLVRLGNERGGAKAANSQNRNGHAANGHTPARAPATVLPARAPEPSAAADGALGAWGAKLDEVTSAEDGERVLAEVDEANRSGALDSRAADGIRRALTDKVASLATPHAPPRQRSQQPGDSTGEEWVRDFKARLAKAPGDALTLMRREVGQAVMHRKITTEVSAVLTAEVNSRRRELEGTPA